MHRTMILLRGGRFSSMLELGGAPMAKTKKGAMELNKYGKNNKVQALVLDFDLITRNTTSANDAATISTKRSGISGATTVSMEAGSNGEGGEEPSSSFLSGVGKSNTTAAIPNVGTVQDMAKLLGINFGGETSSHKPKPQDDLSALTGMVSKEEEESKGERDEQQQNRRSAASSPSPTTTRNETINQKAPPYSDIRSKYAKRIRDKIDGGMAGINLTKHEQSSALKKGDASGHLAARAMVAASHRVKPGSSTTEAGGTRWLANTGTASLLTYATSRSMKVALIPLPNNNDNLSSSLPTTSATVGKRMDDLTKQLKEVTFHVLIKDAASLTAHDILSRVCDETNIPALATFVVSDRDDYLKAGKLLGMYTCRIRPPNARRGNVTTNYTVEGVGKVEEVINEINGISFNSVMASTAGY